MGQDESQGRLSLWVVRRGAIKALEQAGHERKNRVSNYISDSSLFVQ